MRSIVRVRRKGGCEGRILAQTELAGRSLALLLAGSLALSTGCDRPGAPDDLAAGPSADSSGAGSGPGASDQAEQRGLVLFGIPIGKWLAGATDTAAPAAGANATSWVEAIDDEGRTIRLAQPARRIISLLPATTETLVALGGRDRLVARTDYDDAELASLPSVGGGLTPSLEILASLRPDLVIAWEESGGARVRPRLEALGIPVFAVETRDTAAIYANVDRLGRLAGLDASATALMARMRSELTAVQASVAGRPRPRVAYVIGIDPPIVAGPNVFIGEILGVAGGANAFADVTAPSPQVSLEEIVRRRPDIVLLPNSGTGSTSIDRLRQMPGWSELIAGGRTRFHLLPTDILHRPGPSIVEAAWILRDALYPDLAGRR